MLLIAVLGVVLAGLGAALVVTLQSDEGDGTSQEASDPQTSSTAPADPDQADDPVAEGDAEPAADQEALQAAASAYGPVLAIEVLPVGDETYGLAAIETDQGGPGESGLVRVWTSDGSTWTETDPVTSPLSISSWSRSDVTGDGDQDLVVELFTGNGIGGGVLSAVSGQWMFTGFLLADGFLANYVDGPLRVEAAGLTSNVNSCDPNCVDGATVTDVWQYNAARDQFLIADEAGQ